MARSSSTKPGFGDYGVAWLTAMPHERSAAIMMLDETHEQPEDFPKSSADGNNYSRGRIGKHNVVITCLPAGQIGTNVTSSVSQALRSSFPHIRIGLFVGVGAGIVSEVLNPDGKLTADPEHDIRLGDVVVNDVNDPSGGVVQYDFIRAKDCLQHIGSLGRTPPALCSAIASLQATHEYKVSKIRTFAAAALTKHPRATRPWSPPDHATDRLYRSTYPHAGGTTCDNCDERHLIDREPRHEPEIHYGTIASGNTLIKNAAHRDEIVERLRIEGVRRPLCFEMEAAGLMNVLPSLIVRGICDYADSHKNDKW